MSRKQASAMRYADWFLGKGRNCVIPEVVYRIGAFREWQHDDFHLGKSNPVEPEIVEIVRQFVHIRPVERIFQLYEFRIDFKRIAEIEPVHFQYRTNSTAFMFRIFPATVLWTFEHGSRELPSWRG